MNKKLFILSLMALVYLGSLSCMEQKTAHMGIDKTESLWTKLPYELQQIVLSHVGFANATSFEEILDKLTL